jgi:hypothetical protein
VTPKKTVVVSLLGVVLLTGGGKLLQGKLPTYKQIGGITLLFVALSIGVELTPEVAAALALLILVTAALENFGAIAPNIDKFLGAGKKVSK